MAITAKPTGLSLKAATAYTPTHLWMLGENSGTTASDTGSGTAIDLTLQNAAQWVTDGTHGPVLDCNSTSTYYAGGSGTGWDGTNALLLVAIVKTDQGSPGPVAVETIVATAYNANNTNYVSCRNTTTNQLAQAAMNDGTFNTVNGGTLWDQTWRMAAVKFRAGAAQSNCAASIDGSAWTDDANTTVSYANAFNRYGIGYKPSLSSPSIFNGEVAAAWAIEGGTYTDWDDAYVSALYNSGDPWSMILEAAGHPALSRSRGIPGMNTIASRFGRGW
jgi:hypothetical protein